jgi:hypothetical protein
VNIERFYRNPGGAEWLRAPVNGDEVGAATEGDVFLTITFSNACVNLVRSIANIECTFLTAEQAFRPSFLQPMCFISLLNPNFVLRLKRQPVSTEPHLFADYFCAKGVEYVTSSKAEYARPGCWFGSPCRALVVCGYDVAVCQPAN